MYRGKRYTIRIGKVSKTVAKNIVAELKAKILKDEYVEEKRSPIFREVADEYELWYKTHTRARERSKQVHLYRIGLLRDFFGKYPLNRITWATVENYKRKRLEEGASKVTVNKELKLLKTIFRRASETDMYRGEMPKVELFPDKEKEIVRSLTQEEAQRLIEECPEWFKPVIVFALNTGLRAGEIFSLRWEQVDFEKGVIILQRDSTKTKEEYKVFMNSTVVELLKEVKSKQEEKGIDHGFVFTNHLGLPYRYEDRTYRKTFTNACKRAGIKDFRFHDLRHTFASWIAMRSRDIYAVQKLLNHKNIRMTKRYAHLTDDYLKNIVSDLPNFGSSSSKQNNKDSKITEGEERDE